MTELSVTPLRREGDEADVNDLDSIRGELSAVMARLGALSDRIAAADRKTALPAAINPSPTADAIAFFRQQQRLRELQTRIFGSSSFSATGWPIAVELMLARLANTSLSEGELVAALSLAPDVLTAELAELQHQQKVERFYDPADPATARFCLSGDTARRMIEFYRVQRAA